MVTGVTSVSGVTGVVIPVPVGPDFLHPPDPVIQQIPKIIAPKKAAIRKNRFPIFESFLV
jgi:hypothetical protein